MADGETAISCCKRIETHDWDFKNWSKPNRKTRHGQTLFDLKYFELKLTRWPNIGPIYTRVSHIIQLNILYG